MLKGFLQPFVNKVVEGFLCAYLFDDVALDPDADLARHVRKFYR